MGNKNGRFLEKGLNLKKTGGANTVIKIQLNNERNSKKLKNNKIIETYNKDKISKSKFLRYPNLIPNKLRSYYFRNKFKYLSK